MVAHRSEVELQLKEVTAQMVAIGGPGQNELLRHRREQLLDELTKAELALNGLLNEGRIAVANSQVAWHEKPALYRRMYDVPDPPPMPEPAEFDFDADLEGEP